MVADFNKRTKHYTFREIIKQVYELKKTFKDARYEIISNKSQVNVLISLKPTAYSEIYLVKLSIAIGRKNVQVYPVSPYINTVMNGRKVPHMYNDGSLCLYYPKYKEWDYYDSWVYTLIPWISLWLYYYELWYVTGEWLGGGIHQKTKK